MLNRIALTLRGSRRVVLTGRASKSRFTMTSKRGNRRFYKGRGSARMGRHTPFGEYNLVNERVERATFEVPEGLEQFKPYVSRDTPKV